MSCDPATETCHAKCVDPETGIFSRKVLWNGNEAMEMGGTSGSFAANSWDGTFSCVDHKRQGSKLRNWLNRPAGSMKVLSRQFSLGLLYAIIFRNFQSQLGSYGLLLLEISKSESADFERLSKHLSDFFRGRWEVKNPYLMIRLWLNLTCFNN